MTTPPPAESNGEVRAVAVYAASGGNAIGIGIYTIAANEHGQMCYDQLVAGIGLTDPEDAYSLARRLTQAAMNVEEHRKRNPGWRQQQG